MDLGSLFGCLFVGLARVDLCPEEGSVEGRNPRGNGRYDLRRVNAIQQPLKIYERQFFGRI